MTESLTNSEVVPTENGSWTDPSDDLRTGVMGTSETSVEDAVVGGGAGGTVPIAPVALDDLAPGGVGDGETFSGAARDLRLLADVRVEVTVELGRTRLLLRDLLRLSPGAVLELDRGAADGVDVLVNGTPIARGEVFVVDGDFGVRITEILGRP